MMKRVFRRRNQPLTQMTTNNEREQKRGPIQDDKPTEPKDDCDLCSLQKEAAEERKEMVGAVTPRLESFKALMMETRESKTDEVTENKQPPVQDQKSTKPKYECDLCQLQCEAAKEREQKIQAVTPGLETVKASMETEESKTDEETENKGLTVQVEKSSAQMETGIRAFTEVVDLKKEEVTMKEESLDSDDQYSFISKSESQSQESEEKIELRPRDSIECVIDKLIISEGKVPDWARNAAIAIGRLNETSEKSEMDLDVDSEEEKDEELIFIRIESENVEEKDKKITRQQVTFDSVVDKDKNDANILVHWPTATPDLTGFGRKGNVSRLINYFEGLKI